MDHATEVRPNPAHSTALNLFELVHLVRTHVRWIVLPAVVGTVIAAVYSLVASREWWATQTLIIRPEAAGVSDERTGKFTDLSEMKTLQETILELAKSQSVVQAALKEVGPPRRYRRPAQWPTQLDVEEFRECIDMRPPGGAEFGKTEVFYLSIRANDRQRASALVAALCGQLEHRIRRRSVPIGASRCPDRICALAPLERAGPRVFQAERSRRGAPSRGCRRRSRGGRTLRVAARLSPCAQRARAWVSRRRDRRTRFRARSSARS